ncbi:alpha-2-macroglobulin family protein [Alkalilacustris brevis]|uniref:alpha-2-macroglobulin family protein n=1 Tax=Alkalilacustris brevis TaxID=2026338 RepID=UPI000E0D2C99|nr:alpha-2-macroglobulin family protein [Alkalilacustris brevis]
MRAFLSVIALGLLMPFTLVAQDGPVPERRLVIAHDTDFYGADLAQLFDMTLPGCQRACLTDPDCRAFTFNSRTSACFPKSDAGRIEPYEGAISAWVRDTDARVLAQAPDRREELEFLPERDIANARDQAEGLAARHPTGTWAESDLLDEARRARAAGNHVRAANHFGAALNISDAADTWLDYGRALLDNESPNFATRRDYRNRAFLAAVNGYLRAESPALRASIAAFMAEALEQNGRGRDMIPALRLAQSLQPRDDVAAMLDEAIGKYGFRVIDHQVENQLAQPRICAIFSEELVPGGVDYAPYVQMAAQGLAIEAEDRQLCIDGVQHGQRYTLTLRAGLPAESGEVLARPVTLNVYVRDRAPLVRFPGRAYVLPAGGEMALPVETVNTGALDLVLRQVSDRNLVRAMQEEVFARPLSPWQQDMLSEDMTQEVWRGSAELPTELNRDMLGRLPLAEMAGALEPGIYTLEAAVPGADRWDTPAATQWFVVSDLGLSSMQGVDGLHVVVRSLTDAGAKPGAVVRLIARSNAVLGEAETDARGYAMFAPALTRGTGGAAPALLTVSDADGADMAFLSLTDPEFDLSDRGVEGREPAPAVDVFLTTDRGAYRAGETVHLTALARDSQTDAIEGLPLTARLIRPDGVEYARSRTDEAGAGGHTAAFDLAGSAPRGMWRLELFSDDPDRPLASHGLLVEDFLPERIDFDLSLPEGPIRLGDSPQLSIEARYLFGADAADLPIEGAVTLRAAEALAGFPGFRFGQHDDPFRPVSESLPFGERTDDSGRASLLLPLPDIADPARPLEMVLALRLSEGSGRPVERRLTHPLTPEAPVLGIRPLFDDVVPEGDEARFQVVAVGAEGAPAPARLSWTINRVETRYQWYQLYGQWNWEPVTRRERIASGEVTLDGSGPAQIAAPVGWGRHELRIERLDGPYAAASTAFNAGWYAAGDTVDTPDMLELSLDRADYTPGDTAQLRLVPRHAGTALVSVMSNRLIDMQVIEVEEGENIVPLAVTDEWGAGAYVSATVLRPMSEAGERNPARALGLAHAAVDPGARRLAARFDMPPEAEPRAPLDIALRVDGIAPDETAHATIAAVDLGILNLTGFASPDPDGHYFGQRKLGMGLRDIYGRLIDATQGAMGTVRSGGDAAASARSDAPPPTEELVAWFSGPLSVDDDGYARAQMDLPAFNGTVRLMAVVWSQGGVGQAEADLLVRDPVVVSASLPRFMAPGDESRLLLELTHATGPGGTVALDLAAPPGVTLGAAPDSVDLPEGGRARLSVPITAQEPGLHEITVSIATPDGQTLARPLMLPVQANDPQVARQNRLSLAPGEGLTLDENLFADLRPGSASATVAVGPLARFDVAGLVRMLDHYPYGCTEQVAAAAMPLLYVGQTAQAMGLADTAGVAERIDAAIRDVLANQGSGGGFGLWAPSSGDLWLDAFVTDFLSRARTRDHAVPEAAFRMALDNLRNRINYAPDFDAGGAPYAYALMVLAREGAAAIGDLRYYADTRAEAFDTPLAAAQLGAALAAYGDQRRADAMFARAAALVDAAMREGNVWRADYGSGLRDTAGLLALAVEAGSEAVPREALAQQVAAASSGRLSTQEAVWTLLAAHALVDRPAPDGLSIGGAPVTMPVLPVVDARALARAGGSIEIRNDGTQPQMLTLTSFGIPAEPEAAAANGYRITRSHYSIEGQPVQLDAVPAGTRIVTVLEVAPFEDRRGRLMVNDPLPAGFEIDNPNLLRGGDLRALDGFDLLDVTDHAEFRQERFLAAVDWDGARPFRLGYVMRAVSPGSYHHPAASVEDMYRPELRGRTAAGRASVTE